MFTFCPVHGFISAFIYMTIYENMRRPFTCQRGKPSCSADSNLLLTMRKLGCHGIKMNFNDLLGGIAMWGLHESLLMLKKGQHASMPAIAKGYSSCLRGWL